ncbi:MAG TPA: hypothetical protein VHR66_05380 [Gemmataceae bacterium]|nr:hypothetical protein [Gemmataceae bacterium]
MTITLASELERDVVDRAEQLGVPADEVVRRAVKWFLELDTDFQRELQDWQRMTWKAWDIVEEPVP